MKKITELEQRIKARNGYDVSNSIAYKDDYVYCAHCHGEMEWQDCWSCGGEGGRGWEDLQFEDPLWYSPDDFIECDECYGAGGLWICTNDKCNEQPTK